MRKLLHIAASFTAATLIGIAVWGCSGLTRHIIIAVDRFGDAGAQLAQTAAKLNGPHGTIAMADEDVGAAKSLIVHADLVARHEQQSLKTWDARGDALFVNLNGGITDLRGTINAATGTAQAATAALGAAKNTVAAAEPVLQDSDATIKEIEAMTPDIARASKGTADTAEQTAGTATDVHKVADHFEHEIDDPGSRPWYIKILPSVLQDAVQALLTRWSVR